MSFISSFYNARTGKKEYVASGREIGEVREEEVRRYVEGYCPQEYRMVNGEDSLVIVEIDHELSKLFMPKSVPGKKVIMSSTPSSNFTDYRQKW